MSSREQTVMDCILSGKIIAIVRGVDEDKIAPLADALYRGGIQLIEVTFNQSDPAGDESLAKKITMIRKRFDDKLMIGAGTVMTKKQVDVAGAAGADYIISPHVDAELIRYTKEKGMVSIPGAFTASEIAAAHRAGADFVKVFPSVPCGEAYIRAVRAPLSNVRLLAVGGVDETNLQNFLDAGCVGAGIGGSLVDLKKVRAGSFDEIEAAARRLVALVGEGSANVCVTA